MNFPFIKQRWEIFSTSQTFRCALCIDITILPKREHAPTTLFYESKTFKEQWYYVIRRWNTTRVVHRCREKMGHYAGYCWCHSAIVTVDNWIFQQKNIRRIRNSNHTKYFKKKLQPTYPFLQDIEIKNTRSLEMERNVTVQQWMLIYLWN